MPVEVDVPLSTQRFAVVDVETTGLRARRHRILQVAVVTVLGDGTPVDAWSTYVRPSLWRTGPTHIHGLRARDLRGAPSVAAVAPELVRRLDGAVFAAHNASFDWAFVARALRRAGFVVPDAERLCTLRLSRSLDPDRQRSHRLADLVERYGVEPGPAHDATADATATAALLPGLLSEAGLTTVCDLAPYLRGATRTWPAPHRAAWPLRVRQRFARPRPPARAVQPA